MKNLHNYEAEALDFMREHGLRPDSVTFDGKEHRDGTADKPDGSHVSYTQSRGSSFAATTMFGMRMTILPTPALRPPTRLPMRLKALSPYLSLKTAASAISTIYIRRKGQSASGTSLIVPSSPLRQTFSRQTFRSAKRTAGPGYLVPQILLVA